MTLTDILPIEKWMALEKKIHARSGLDSNVFDPNGYRITEYKKWVNRLCPVIKDSDKGQSFICAVAHMNVSTLAKQSKQPVIEECDGGLIKLVVPIYMNDEFIGAVGACGLLMAEGEVDAFMINRTIGLEEEKIEELARDIKSLTQEELIDLSEFIVQEIDHVIRRHKTEA